MALIGVNEGEEIANHVARNEGLAGGEVDMAGTVGPEGVEEDGALFLDVFSGCVGGVGHVAENLLGTSASKKRHAATEVIGEADGVEPVGELVAFLKRLMNMKDFCIRKTEVELAETLATLVGEVMGVRENVVFGDGVGLGKYRVGRGVVAEVITAGEVVDGEDDERGKDRRLSAKKPAPIAMNFAICMVRVSELLVVVENKDR